MARRSGEGGRKREEGQMKKREDREVHEKRAARDNAHSKGKQTFCDPLPATRLCLLITHFAMERLAPD